MCKYLLSVFYCYFLNTCHICIHMHRLVPCSSRGTLYEHWIQSQPFYNIDLFCYTWWYAPAIACYQHDITICAWLNIHASRHGVWVLKHCRQQINISDKYNWCNIQMNKPLIQDLSAILSAIGRVSYNCIYGLVLGKCASYDGCFICLCYVGCLIWSVF